jgi:hypothetical protein
MAQKPPVASRDSSPRPRSVPRAPEGVKQPRNGSAKSVAEARRDLEERGTRNREGGVPNRSDPIADARAARAVAGVAREHTAELARRGLSAAYSEVAVQLAAEIEDHLQALPAAALAARGRIPEHAELLADAAATAQAVREAILRVTRGPDGRTAAHAFGLGDPFSTRQPQHVLRALDRIVTAASEHAKIATDAGLVSDDLHTMRDLAAELRTLPGAGSPLTDGPKPCSAPSRRCGPISTSSERKRPSHSPPTRNRKRRSCPPCRGRTSGGTGGARRTTPRPRRRYPRRKACNGSRSRETGRVWPGIRPRSGLPGRPSSR